MISTPAVRTQPENGSSDGRTGVSLCFRYSLLQRRVAASWLFEVAALNANVQPGVVFARLASTRRSDQTCCSLPRVGFARGKVTTPPPTTSCDFAVGQWK